ncbi:hypothetical protein B7494_g6647 [Chlorociboria aeruginascens]|nr:hypothetical protein B7494_g6647 [Chlorociboria aeruginascens]
MPSAVSAEGDTTRTPLPLSFPSPAPVPFVRQRQTQHSAIAKALMSNNTQKATAMPSVSSSSPPDNVAAQDFALSKPSLLSPPTTTLGRALSGDTMGGIGTKDPAETLPGSTPSTAPGSPRLFPIRQNSGSSTPRIRPPPTTLNIPGMTRSRVSPDGKIAQRDVASKLVIIMVGLPARGKSYITKKIHRYVSWQQHEVKIFNVGNRRRVAAGGPGAPVTSEHNVNPIDFVDAPTQAAHILLNGVDPNEKSKSDASDATSMSDVPGMDQSAKFFDPMNTKAAIIRDKLAMSTLDELLEFLLEHGGSVGILDATNSTIQRRTLLFNHIKEREPKLGIVFIESVCENQKLLDTNKRLKLSGPDYKGKDPQKSLHDFEKRIKAYQSAYVPLGEYEEQNGMQYIKMIDVGSKVVHYRLAGFLAGNIASYLSTFNLAPRQIWITRHGKSVDNCLGKLGGNSDLTPEGRIYGRNLYNFITRKRQEWTVAQGNRELEGASNGEGSQTPPFPDTQGDLENKNFCVWTSMLKRSIETAEDFESDDDYDVKAWEMLNELNAGSFEGLTYKEIAEKYPDQFEQRSKDKLHYIYPGVGGEGYLQIIARMRDMVREIERIHDHVLIIGHRSVARVLMAYFMDLTRDDIADLDVPLGMLYCIEPKPYGIEFHAYKHNMESGWFDELEGYKPQKETEKGN